LCDKYRPMESEDDQTAIGSGAEMMADSLAWPINKRILLVVINLIIMVRWEIRESDLHC